MKFKITNTELEINDKNFSKSIEKKAFSIVQKTKVPLMKRRVSKAMTQAVQALPKAVEGILEKGVGPLSAGNKYVNYASPFGNGRYTTKSWRALTTPYKNQPPKSKKFWMKHPGGGTYKHGAGRRETLLSLFRGSADYAAKVTSGKTVAHSQTKKYKRITWDVKLGTSAHPVLKEMMYLSMLHGLTDQAPRSYEHIPGINNRDISMIGYVEGRRPLIRGVSHAIGKKAAARVKQVMRPKI